MTIKQDISILTGFENDTYDYAFANNVLYAVSDVVNCLSEIRRVLKVGGELRVSGPRKDTSLDVLFNEIHVDLERSGKFEELEKDYNHVKEINELRLNTMLYRWTIDEFCRLLLSDDIGFSSIKYKTDHVYANQSMLICAIK